jgi:hypothetical protein
VSNTHAISQPLAINQIPAMYHPQRRYVDSADGYRSPPRSLNKPLVPNAI